MSRFTVEVVAQAAEQAERIHAWWQRERLASPRLFRAEFAAALDALAITPELGVRYEPGPVPGLRRLFLARCRCHVYYAVDMSAQRVLVLAVWHSARGQGPEL